MDLIADIGATNTRCALLNDKGQEVAAEVFHNADFTGIPGLLAVYLDHRRASDRPKRAALAVAAPIVGDEVQMINIDWRFSQTELKAQLGLSRLLVCNDFAAIAWALPQLGPGDVRKIGGGTPTARAALAALGPGSGLGVSALIARVAGWAFTFTPSTLLAAVLSSLIVGVVFGVWPARQAATGRNGSSP